MNNCVFVGFSCIPLNAELNPTCHLLALLGGATIVVVSRLRVNTCTITDCTVSQMKYVAQRVDFCFTAPLFDKVVNHQILISSHISYINVVIYMFFSVPVM